MSDTRTEQLAAMQADLDAGNVSVHGDWLVLAVNEHTCGTSSGGYYGMHEPGCGTVPLARIADLIFPETANTFALTASPAQIHEAVDALRDLGVTDTGWEYTDYEAIHHSGFRFVAADGYMPEELRPDIGVDW
jgi:hypothetical protein